MDLLACPLCGNSLALTIDQTRRTSTVIEPLPGCLYHCELISKPLVSDEDREEAHQHCLLCYGEDVVAGLLTCGNGHPFSIQGSIPRFIHGAEETQRTKKTFDVEWQVFTYGKEIYGHSPEEELQDFFHRMAVDHHFLRGKCILDAGCGIGRLASSISSYAKELVALDFSGGVEEAYILNQMNPFVHIIQGDIMHLPFRKESFDYAYSKGVLHYVADVRQCLVSLSSVVRPGGALSATIYPEMTPRFETFNRILRKVSVKLPVALIYLLSFLLIPFLSLTCRWSGMKSRPVAWNERAHMIFNWFASEFQNRASNEEMASRFRALNFNQLRLSKVPVGITGFKRPGTEGRQNEKIRGI